MSYEEDYRQLVSGNLHEKRPFTFECSHVLLGDPKTLFKELLMCYQSGSVACIAVGCLQKLPCVTGPLS